MTFTTILALILACTVLPHSSAYLTDLTTSTHFSREVTNTSKAGLAWPNSDREDMNQYRSSGKVSWYYSWSPYPTDTDLEYVPMLWGERQVEQFTTTINQTLAEHQVTSILGMNEPEQAGQANLTPQQGADMWRTHLEPLRARGLRLGSPASSSAPSGRTWVQDFLTACGGGCTVDFIALHWYGVNATQFIRYLEDFHNTFQRPIWVTEWACHNFVDANLQCSEVDIALFLNATQTYMDNSEFVERYSWFGAMRDMSGVNQLDALMDSDGHINDLGRQYVGGPPQVDGTGSAEGPTQPSSGGNGGGGGFSLPGRNNAQRQRSLSFIAFLSVFVVMCTVA